MRTIRTLLVGYLCAGLIVAGLQNWQAHLQAGSSIFEVMAGHGPMAEKTAALYDLVLFPILAWPARVVTTIRGG